MLRSILTTILSSLLVAGLAWGQDYRLVWSDEFDGMGVDPLQVVVPDRRRLPGSLRLGQQRAAVLPGAERHRLRGAADDHAPARSRSVAGTTRRRACGPSDLGDWTYGRFEMRATMPIGPGPVAGLLDALHRRRSTAAGRRAARSTSWSTSGTSTNHVVRDDSLRWIRGRTTCTGARASPFRPETSQTASTTSPLEWDPERDALVRGRAAVLLPEPLELGRRELPGAVRPGFPPHPQHGGRWLPARSSRCDDDRSRRSWSSTTSGCTRGPSCPSATILFDGMDHANPSARTAGSRSTGTAVAESVA